MLPSVPSKITSIPLTWRKGTVRLRIDYEDDGAIHALVHLNLNSSALDYHN